MASADRYSDCIDEGSATWASAVSAAQPSGMGSQVSTCEEKPYDGSLPDQGIGIRHASRPRSAWPERSQIGSCSASSGRSTSGMPSSSPL
jgi:hypothetical protein